MSQRLINNIKQTAKKRFSKIKAVLFPNSNDLTIEDVSFWFVFLFELNASEEAAKIATIPTEARMCGILGFSFQLAITSPRETLIG